MKSSDAFQKLQINASPPSRGAWIEIFGSASCLYAVSSRPPRGGRGLKYWRLNYAIHHLGVAPLAGGVD